MFLPRGRTFGNAVLVGLAGLTESGEGNGCGCGAEAQMLNMLHPELAEHPAPRVLSRAGAQPELESSVCTYTKNKHVGTQDL